MTSLSNYTTEQRHGFSSTLGHEKYCDQYLLVSLEAALGDGVRAFLYFMGLAYCFIGLSAITARFFLSMENVVKHTRTVVEMDPCTNKEIVRSEKVWNYTIADITLLAFGTSFPQICLATIDAILNIGNLYAGGLGPGTLVGSAAFGLFPIHAVCVVVPKAGELKRIEDIGVWLVELFWSFWAYIWLYIILECCNLGSCCFTPTHRTSVGLPLLKGERPEECVPAGEAAYQPLHDQCSEVVQVGDEENGERVEIFSIHSGDETGKF